MKILVIGKECLDVSGAGDTFLAGLVAAYSKNRDLGIAIRFANRCAGEAVSKKGVISYLDAAI